MVILILLSLTFTASVDNTIVPVGESFNVSVNIEGEKLSGINAPQAPEIAGIDILGSSRSQSTQINFINGKLNKSTSISHDYQMIARKEGTFTIPPFTLEHKGRKYSTDSIKITVKKGIARSNVPSSSQNNYNNIRTESSEFRPVFAESQVSKNSVYAGEPLIVSHYIYAKNNIRDIRLAEAPSYENVWVENIQSANKIDFKRTTRNGISWQRMLIKKDVLFSLGEKDIKINPFSLQVLVTGGFTFFGERKVITSEAKTIRVKPFPANRPPEFIDAVGKFSLTAELDTSNLKVDAPFTLKITIKGEGNLSLLSAPKFPGSRKISSYEPESDANTYVSGNALKGERVFSYLLTPKVSGVIEIPEIRWAYFDLNNKTFVKKELGPWKIQVRPGSEIGGKEESANQANKDIAYILPLRSKTVSLIPRFFPLLFLPSIILFALSAYYVIDTRKTLGDRRYASMKAIPRELKTGFKKMEKELEGDNPTQFYEDLTRLLLKFLKLKFHMDPFGMKKTEIISELTEKKAPEEILTMLKELLERSETVRFTSIELEEKDMTKDLKTAKEVINALY
jgi:hypothetical protein